MVGDSVPVVMVDVEAATEEEALPIAFRQATTSIEPYSLIGIETESINFTRRRPIILPHALLIDEQSDPPEVALRYHDGPRLVRMNIGQWAQETKTFNQRVLRELAQRYPASLNQAGAPRTALESRLARAVHWYAQGEEQIDPTMAFVCYWIGLEAMALKSSTSSNKKQTLSRRMAQMVRVHDANADWSENINVLWDKRSDIVHEGFGAVPEGLIPDVDAGDLNQVKYLFFVALQYTVDQNDAGIELEDLWHPRNADHYVPNERFRYAEFPSVMQSLSMKRESRPRRPDDP